MQFYILWVYRIGKKSVAVPAVRGGAQMLPGFECRSSVFKNTGEKFTVFTKIAVESTTFPPRGCLSASISHSLGYN
jgi:hypothetical protein